MQEARRYKLSRKQSDFILSEAQFSCYAGGWASGKTLAGCVAVFKRAKEQPNSLWLIGRRTYPDLRDSTLRDFLELVGMHGTFEKSTYTFRLPNGAEIIFRHLDNIRSLTNTNLSGFLIDQAEELPEDVFIFLRGRIRRPGPGKRQGLFICNMEGHNWIWRLFKNEATRLADTLLVESTTYDNASNLPADFLKQLESLPDIVKRRYVMASWDAFEGQVFDEFEEHTHVVQPFAIPREWDRYESIDHGYNHPTAVLWWAVDFDGNVYAYDEHYERKMLIEEHVRAILSHRGHSAFGGDNQTIQATYIDPSTRAENQEYKGQLTSVQKLYIAHSNQKVLPIPGANDKAAGVNLMKQFMKIAPERLNPRTGRKGSPRLFFFPTCQNLIEEVRTYAWKRLRPQDEGKKANPEEPVKVHDDAIDSMKYFILSHFGATARQQPEAPRNVGEMVQRDLELAAQNDASAEFELDIS